MRGAQGFESYEEISFSHFRGWCCRFVFRCLAPDAPEGTSVNVTQHHNNASRDGLYVDPAFTTAAAAGLTRDLILTEQSWATFIPNRFMSRTARAGPVVIVATQSNNVYALNALTAAIIWQRNVGTPHSSLGNISPIGITGTPVVDLASRSLFFDAVISGPNNLIFSLNVDTGATNPGWPVNVNARISGFSSPVKANGVHSVSWAPSFTFHTVDILATLPPYFGRVLGVQISDPAATIGSFATTSTRAGIWAPGGIASDGTNLFVTTGNGAGGVTWNGSEAVIRLQPGPSFTGSTTDYWAPTDWATLDGSDEDLGGSGPVLVDVPGATPSALVVQYGKDSKVYLLNRNNLGGVSAPLSTLNIGGSGIQCAAAYRTATGTYVVFRPTTGTLTALRITATNPPTLQSAWSVSSSGRGSPFVTSTDGTNNVIVWAVGSSGDQRLHGHNGDTGAVVYNGGGGNELMTGTRGYNTAAIAARGRIYVANDNRVYAFNVPAGNPRQHQRQPLLQLLPPRLLPLPPLQLLRQLRLPPLQLLPRQPQPQPQLRLLRPPARPQERRPLTSRPGCGSRPAITLASAALSSPEPLPSTCSSGPSDLRCSSGVPNALADPVLELNGPGSFVTVINDNWRDDPTQEALIEATGIAPTNDFESAIDARLTPGAYTAIVRGNGNTSGVGLVEVYDLNPGVDSKLGNISTRAFVNTGDGIVIAGFILGGSSNDDRVALRGIGPSLTGLGVPNALPDPTLELRDGNGALLMANNDWQDDPAQAAELTAAGLAPTNTLESGIATTLPPGLYTALLAGLNNGTGVGLVEVYDRGAP